MTGGRMERTQIRPDLLKKMKTSLIAIITFLCVLIPKAEAHQQDSIRSVSYYMYQYDQDRALTISHAEPDAPLKKRSNICEGWSCVLLGVVGAGIITAVVFGARSWDVAY